MRESARPLLLLAALLLVACSAPEDDSSQPTPSPMVVELRDPDRVIDGLDNLVALTDALGSVWAATSNQADEFSSGEVRAEVLRIDPGSGRVEPVLSTVGVEPSFVQAGGVLWVKLADRVAGLDANGAEVVSITLDLGRSDELASVGGLLWVVLTDEDRVLAIDPATAEILGSVATGDFPVSPVSAFGSLWVPNLIDGTISVIDPAAGPDGVAVDRPATEGPKFVFPVPEIDADDGDEVWVTNTAGQVVALTVAEWSRDQPRPLGFDRSINSVIAHQDRVFLLPTWGTSVLVVDRRTETMLAEIPIDSIPVRGLSANGSIWVTGDGGRETLTRIDPDALVVLEQFAVGSNESRTVGPQQPIVVGDEIWVPNRGDGAVFVVEAPRPD